MNKSITLASALLAATSYASAEIVINDFLSFEGFVDMSYAHFDADVDGEVDGTDLPEISESDNSFQIDQVEISWLFDFETVTAQIDLQYEDRPGDTTNVEQAFASYHIDETHTITAGRYASMLGFEAFEPTGLYQYSTAYGLPASAGPLLGFASGTPFEDFIDPLVTTAFPIGARYNQGIKYTYEADNAFFGVSVQDGVSLYSDRLGGDFDSDGGGYGVEVAGSYYMDNGLSFFLGGSYEDGDGIAFGGFPVTGDTQQYILNSYATFETGAWIFAAEIFYGDSELDDIGGFADADSESLGGLIMANFAYSEKASVTGRVSYVNYELEGSTSGFPGGDLTGDADADVFKYTLAHNYSFTDNLLLVAEVSYTDAEADGSITDGTPGGTLSGDLEADEILAAVELLFSF